MSTSHAFIDCDTVYDLSALGLIDHLCPVLGVDIGDVYTLRAVVDQVRRVGRLSLPAKARALHFFETTGKAWFRTEEGSKLNRELGDLGVHAEALLFACAAEAPESAILTGDLKSIRAVCTWMSDPLVAALAGRVLITETVLIKIHAIHGWPAIQTAFALAEAEGSNVSKFPSTHLDEHMFLTKLSSKIANACSVPGFIAFE